MKTDSIAEGVVVGSAFAIAVIGCSYLHEIAALLKQAIAILEHAK